MFTTSFLQCSSKNVSIFYDKAFEEITGAKVNRGAGYGLEVPCVYRLYGPNIYVDKMKALVESLHIIICVIVTLLNDNWRFFVKHSYFSNYFFAINFFCC